MCPSLPSPNYPPFPISGQVRIDALSLDARLAVKVAAVIGEVFSLRLLMRCCPGLTDEQLLGVYAGAIQWPSLFLFGAFGVGVVLRAAPFAQHLLSASAFTISD